MLAKSTHPLTWQVVCIHFGCGIFIDSYFLKTFKCPCSLCDSEQVVREERPMLVVKVKLLCRSVAHKNVNDIRE